MAGEIRIGIGGWTFEPWRGVFYPEGLTHKRELEFASRALTSIEINGTYYSTFKPDSWRKWRDETPDDFVFAVKGSRFCTNRRVLADAAESVAKFMGQGLSQLGAKLGPINWQFMATKKFDGQDFGAFLALLPREKDGIALRHAIEARHPSFACAEIYEPTSDFTYARLMATQETLKTGVSEAELTGFAKQAKAWAKRGDVFAYFISGAKVRNPAAAQALIKKLG